MTRLLLAFILALALPALAQAQTQAASVPTRIPFLLIEDRVVVVLEVEGQKVQAVLDTGARGTVIDTAYARQRGFRLPPGLNPFRPAPPGRGARTVNDQPAGVVFNVTMQLGDLRFSISPGVTDLSTSVVEHFGAPVVLGRELFEVWVVELDFERKEMVLHDRAGFQPPPRLAPIRVTRMGGGIGAPMIPISVEGAPALEALIDTGDERVMGVNQTTAKALNLDQRRSNTYQGSGVNVTTNDRIITAARISIGGVTLEKAPMAIITDDTPVFGNDKARIGLPLLARFHVWFDLAGNRMWLQPTLKTRDPFRKDTLGFGGKFEDDAVKIDRVAPGSPAASAGLKTGDQIVAINEQPAQQFLSERPWNLLAPLSVTLKDGRILRLRPAEFY